MTAAAGVASGCRTRQAVARDGRADALPAGLPAVSGGVPVTRQIAGAAVVVTGLPVLTAALVHDRESLPLATPVLLVLLVVVLAALLGGLRVGVPAALARRAGVELVLHRPVRDARGRPSGPAARAGRVPGGVGCGEPGRGVAARRTAEANRAKAEAQALSSLAGAALAEVETLPGVLEQVRSVFGVREVVLLEYEAGQWSAVETVSDATPPGPDDAELRLQINPTLALLVRGPALFGEDQRVLRSFAQSAATALEGRRLALRAAAAAQFEAADQMRTALLAAVGHDLRTPLAGVKAAVSSLRQRDVQWTQEETDELLETIENSADRLQHLVANLLDASRLQAGVVSVDPEAASLDEVVDRALVTSEPAKPNSTWTFPTRLPESGSTVAWRSGSWPTFWTTRCSTAPPSNGSPFAAPRERTWCVCEVIDHGPGVPEHLWTQIFSPFQRFGDRQPGGIGLGLAIARGFTDAMGGRLQPSRTPGGGLTMQLLLPAATHADGRQHDPRLVVDDEPALVRALSINLRARGYDVHTAGTGAAALRRGGDDTRPIWWSWTWACPTWTAAKSSPACEAGPRSPSSSCPPGKDRRPRSPHSTPAPTTTSSSPSAWTNCWPDSAPPFAARPPTTPNPSSSPTTSPSTWPRSGSQPTTGRSSSPPPSGTCWRSWSATTAAPWSTRSCSRKSGGRTTPRRATTSGSTSLRSAANSRPDPSHPRYLHHRQRPRLPLPEAELNRATSLATWPRSFPAYTQFPLPESVNGVVGSAT